MKPCRGRGEDFLFPFPFSFFFLLVLWERCLLLPCIISPLLHFCGRLKRNDPERRVKCTPCFLYLFIFLSVSRSLRISVVMRRTLLIIFVIVCWIYFACEDMEYTLFGFIILFHASLNVFFFPFADTRMFKKMASDATD